MDTITDRLAKTNAAANAVIARADELGITVTGLSVNLASFSLHDDVNVYIYADDKMRLAEDAGAEAFPWYGDAKRRQRELVWTVLGVRVAVYEVAP